jgi:hypothetical protein
MVDTERVEEVPCARVEANDAGPGGRFQREGVSHGRPAHPVGPHVGDKRQRPYDARQARVPARRPGDSDQELVGLELKNHVPGVLAAPWTCALFTPVAVGVGELERVDDRAVLEPHGLEAVRRRRHLHVDVAELASCSSLQPALLRLRSRRPGTVVVLGPDYIFIRFACMHVKKTIRKGNLFFFACEGSVRAPPASRTYLFFLN